MRCAILFVGSLLLAGCTFLHLPPEPSHAPPLSTSDVIEPFTINPNVVEVSAQLKSKYTAGSVQVLRVGNEIKVTYPSDTLFGVGGEEVLPSAQKILNPLIKVTKTYPQASVNINCFTDKSGTSQKNVAYSDTRAHSIARYLESSRVVADKISSKGYGGDYPVASNETAAGRALNRRVVITISEIPTPLPVVT